MNTETNLLSEIVLGVLVSLIWFLLGILTRAAVNSWKERKARKMWKPFLGSESVYVVLSTRLGEKESSTPRVSLLEIRAYAELTIMLSRLKIKSQLVSGIFSHTPLEKVKNSHLIILGAPGAINQIAEAVWQDLESSPPYQYYPEGQYITYRDEKFVPDTSSEPRLDFAIIVLTKNPYIPNKKVIMAIGCHGYSTYGAVKALVEKNTLDKLANLTKGRDFVALVEMELRQDEITQLRVRNDKSAPVILLS